MLDKAEYSAFESTLNSAIVSYRIVSGYSGPWAWLQWTLAIVALGYSGPWL